MHEDISIILVKVNLNKTWNSLALKQKITKLVL